MMEQNSAAFLKGRQMAINELENWKENGFSSMADAESFKRQVALEDLEIVQKLDPNWEGKQRNIEMWKGYLSGLDGYLLWINPPS